MKDESRYPQTMEVAVGVDRFDFIALAESEADLRLLAGMQFLALIALLGLERYPLDVVLWQHGMLQGAVQTGTCFSTAASVVPGTISFIGSPQQMTGTPMSLILVMILPQCLQR